MENQLSFERLTFPVDRWLCDDEDDGDVVRELPVPEPDSNPPKDDDDDDTKDDSEPPTEPPKEPPLLKTRYNVAVMTGDKFGAGTNANVYMTLFGEKGDSGKRGLRLSLEDQNKFESGKVSEREKAGREDVFISFNTAVLGLG